MKPASTLLWVNGTRVADLASPQLSALDRGFGLADGLFETLRLYRGRPFRLAQHLDRLARGATRLELPLPAGLEAEVLAAAREAQKAGLEEAVLRVSVSRGPGERGLLPPASPHPTVVVLVQPVPELPLALSLHTVRGRRNEYGPTAGLKTLSYTDALVSLLEARAAGADDALLLDTQGHVCEASASNIFFVVDGALCTPPAGCGVLPGITRTVVLELARTLRLCIEESPLSPSRAASAREAFVTSSVREVLPVRSLDEVELAACPGPLCLKLQQAYRERVRAELGLESHP